MEYLIKHPLRLVKLSRAPEVAPRDASLIYAQMITNPLPLHSYSFTLFRNSVSFSGEKIDGESTVLKAQQMYWVVNESNIHILT